MKKLLIILLSFLLFIPMETYSQRKRNQKNTKTEKVSLNAFKFRNIGPGFLSGRIADIAIHPENENTWYVAAGSGGVWMTDNAGTTWNPIFDNESSYSIGAITIDTSNPNIVWVGTGENVGGRHVAYGDGIYKSMDGGKSWKNLGLKKSEHISKIIVHPDNSDVVWVAVQGPLWSSGGERGLYKTTDGGQNWYKTLGDSEWTGVTDIMIDPRNPNLIYAATWDRHRTVAAYMGGGPGSGIHKSEDGGETWKKLTNGIPKSNLGKIGIAISYQKPDIIYAAIEEDRTKGGVYRSTDRGESWKKMSNTVSGGTGPHYYQELYTSPHEFDRLYLMNVHILTSKDGGKNFEQLTNERNFYYYFDKKHSDHHAMAFKHSDPDYLMVGTDAGIYESFDDAKNWHYFLNLPLTQFYKVAVNNKEPFYHIFGGTQDNGSAGGPSATDEEYGITNRVWYKTLMADGHQSATDPVYDDIMYATTQEGGFHRVDLTTGEQVYIKPQPEEGDPYERFNWDTPIIVSPHNPARIYIGSYRVWQSENRGDSWNPISGDQTRNENRIELPILGRKQSWDNSWDVKAMSQYNTITSLSESPLKEGLIWSGTDDGFIHVTTDGGESWKEIPVTDLGLPERTFVNDIKADLFDENTVYVSLDNHKEGDLNPYLFKSTDLGESWESISNNIPERTLIWRLVQDHIEKDLLFIATEFGVYASLNGGEYWQKIPGTPTISFRDLVIQKRENDLVAASFGRGFFVLDDYSALREMVKKEYLNSEGKLFKPRDAKLFKPRNALGNTGGQYYVAENPTFGAVFTYYLKDVPETIKSKRKKMESSLNSQNQDIPFPGYDSLTAEMREKPAQLLLSISDSEGNLIRNVNQRASKGTGKIVWNLKHKSYNTITSRSGWRQMSGPFVTPGNYYATLYIQKDGALEKIDGPIEFGVNLLREGVLKGASFEEYNSHAADLAIIYKEYLKYYDTFSRFQSKLNLLEKALMLTESLSEEMFIELENVKSQYLSIRDKYGTDPAKNEIGEWDKPTISSRLSIASQGLSTFYGPTGMNKYNLEIARELVDEYKNDIESINTIIEDIEEKIKALNHPHISGSGIN